MKKILFTICLLAIATEARAACANNAVGAFHCAQSVQAVYQTSATPSLAFGSNLTSGSVIVGMIGWGSTGETLNSLTGCGATWTLIDNPTTVTAAFRSSLFYGVGGTGACTMSFTLSSSLLYSIVAHEITGADTSAPVGTRHQINAQLLPGTGTDAVTSGAGVTASGTDYIFTASMDFTAGAAINAGTGYTGREAGAGLESEDKAASGSNVGTFTETSGASNNATGIISLRVPVAAPTSNQLMLTGMGL